jgi:hypothetical protein
MPENVARLATAVAVRDHYRRSGRGKLDKPPKYEADMLEFMEGARIVGIIFPEKWGGKYCLGRHDGDFGAFPAKAIEMRPPQETEIPMGGENGMSVTTRWKWQPPGVVGPAPWLSFGKGEAITNVQCETSTRVSFIEFSPLTIPRRSIRRLLVLVWYQRQRKDWRISPVTYRLANLARTGLDGRQEAE